MQYEGGWYESDGEGVHFVVDETEPNPDYCMANVGPSDSEYQSCGLKMRRRKNGVTICPEHGEMH